MKTAIKNLSILFFFFLFQCGPGQEKGPGITSLAINEKGYFSMPGLNVMVFEDIYPEGHQGGVGIVLNGTRVATNGDLRLEPTPGQWAPIPKVGDKQTDTLNNLIRVELSYPDSSRHRKGFNPIIYPDLHFKYEVVVESEGDDFLIRVNLEEPLPPEWIGRVGFNLELFPGLLFGKSWYLDQEFGIFPQQANGPMVKDQDDELQIVPMATGNELVVAPESDELRMKIKSLKAPLKLYDGRGKHNNGWFIVRSEIMEGATENAVEWRIEPHLVHDYEYEPVIQVSQVGYHPRQPKFAVIELDERSDASTPAILHKIGSSGKITEVKSEVPPVWGNFLRYKYRKFDFSEVTEPGMYKITYGDEETSPFALNENIYDRHVWQPTLEYFLPVQMCHMRVNDRYRVWHGLCHMDDALMAPIDTNHFDGYVQGASTLTSYQPMQAVPGLNVGGWHDAGDYDLRVESQAGTVFILSQAYELFGVDYDQTSIDQEKHLVEIHQPDGKNDILQQVEHGVLTILAGYQNLGRLYRGIICPTLRQYTLLGDGSTMTDNRVYDASLPEGRVEGPRSGIPDDRWVFTEENPRRELEVAAALAAAYRVLKEYNPQLAAQSLEAAESIWEADQEAKDEFKIGAAVELLLATDKQTYHDFLVSTAEIIRNDIETHGWLVGRVMDQIEDQNFRQQVRQGIQTFKDQIEADQQENPYGVPYRPRIWGAGWGIQKFGVNQYFLHHGFPDIFPADYMLNALNFVLGVHPGENTASFASGVGSNSLIVAYGTNRAEWSYIPGGVGSGTALLKPDLPEMKEWPYFWQQTEYVMGGGASNFLFLTLAARSIYE